MDTTDTRISFHPWQLGLEPPAGTYFELGGDGGAAPAAGDLGGADLGAGAGTAVAEPPAADAAPDPAAGAAATGDVEYLGQDELADLVREQAGSAFSEMMQRAAADQQAAAQARQQAAAREAANQPPEWDPFDPSSVENYVAWKAQQLVAPLLEKIDQASQFVEQGQIAAGKSQAEQILEGFKTGDDALGEFDNGKAILQAAAYMRAGADPEQALAQAASEQAAFEQAIEARAIEKFKAPAQALADAGAEPAGGAGAAAEVVASLNGAGQRRDYKTEARATMARLRGGPGVGEGVG